MVRPFHHKVLVRHTDFRLSLELQMQERLNITDLYAALMQDEDRNSVIVSDVMKCIGENRFPVLLTERREHLDYFENALRGKIENVVALRGGMGKKQIAAAQEALDDLDEDEPKLILATGRYLGEGFDHARLDTLFLALPVSWKGTIAQYAGRLHRLHHSKREVIIYDYADTGVPMLAKMYGRRLKGYQAIGYEIENANSEAPPSLLDKMG
jgi:superfamily II DNA or RNA helicase